MADLLERDRELADIGAAVAALAHDGGQTVVVQGPPGIGKTRLLDAVVGQARRAGCHTLTSCGGELEGDFAYGVVRQLFERHVAAAPVAERGRLLTGAAALAGPSLGLLEPDEQEPRIDTAFTILHGLYWLVANLADRGPLCLVVDDAHWADSPSLRFLAYLARRLEDLPVLIVIGARPDVPGADLAVLAEIAAERRTRTFELSGLTAAAVARSVEAQYGTVPGARFTDACLAATGGNPFLVGELLAELRRDGVGPTDAEAGRVDGVTPETVSRSILLRITRLRDRASAELAEAAAILGHQASLTLAAQLAGLEPEAAVQAARRLTSVGILDAGSALAFTHPIVRAAVYAALTPGARSVAHARAAELLRAQGAPAGRLAPHLLAVEPAGAAGVVADLRAAADDALARGASDIAARYLLRALAEPPVAALRADVLAELGWTELSAGLPTEAIAHLKEGLAGTRDAPLQVERAVRLARAVFTIGDAPAALDLLEESLGGQADDARLRLEVEMAALGLVDARTVTRVAARLERFAELDGETPVQRLALASAAMHFALVGARPADEVGAVALRAIGGGALIDEERSQSTQVYEALYALTVTGHHEVAADGLEAALAEARAAGSAIGYTSACTVRALLHLERGSVPDTEADARAAIEATMANKSILPMTQQLLADALIFRGALDEADGVLEEAGAGNIMWEAVHVLPLLCARGRLRLAQGRFDEGLDDLYDYGRRTAALGAMNPVVAWRPLAAVACAAAGRLDEARTLTAEEEARAAVWGAPVTVAVARRTRGQVEGDPEVLAAAVAMLELTPARLELAQAHLALGETLRRSGSRTRARDQLRSALAIADQCGATALADRAHRELVVAGARPRSRQFSGVDALTASERRVALMAADGPTNREIAQALFVTPKTVEAHLARAYAKLGIASRSGLAEALALAETSS